LHSAIARSTYDLLPRHPLIVCASLVQNPANLGGLCRTAEAFRLEALVLADLAIAKTTPFKNLSASTHRWQPLQACPVDRLSDWLMERQQLGYQVIALDANPQAIPMDQFTFAPQTVLLLGQELTGLPQPLLGQCDRIVTIPQYGLVESLNVQTAAAIAMYEYVRQRHRT
jgi:tRNA guanosine-2'-O-methyltransferase